MKLARKVGSTSQVFQVFIQDSSSTTGAGLTGLTNASSGLTAYYHRDTDTTATAIALVTMTVGSFTSSGFKEVDATNMPGWYQLCPPNAALAAGAASVGIHLKGATNMAPLPIEVDLGAQVDVFSVGGTAQTARDLGGSVLLSSGTGTGQVSLSSGLVSLSSAQTFNVTGSITGSLSGSVGSVTGAVGSVTAQTVRTGTAQAGAATTITLDSGASGTNNLYVGLVVVLTGGTGAGQARTITGYNQGTKIATVDRNWTTNPGATSTFALLATDNPALNNTLQVGNGANTIVIRTGTAQSGSTANTIKLDSGASATNNLYAGALVQLTSGTGLGQVRTIVSYVGSTKVATVDRNWVTTPDNTSAFSIVSASTPSTFSDQGVAQAATSSTITLASTASATSSIYNGSILTILSGTDAGDTAEITAYNGTTKVATITPNWAVTPDTTSAYAVIPVVASSGVVTGTDPLSSAVPGTYAAGTAGYVLGTNLDATVSSRASPTNITAGTITTVTNLTNAPTAGDFTSTMKTSIGTAVAASAVASVTAPITLPTIPTDWIGAAGVSAAAVTKIQAGLSTYAGGDTAGTTTLLARLTSARAGYLDNLAAAPPTAAAIATAVLTTAMSEDYNADGAAPTLAQAQFVTMQRLTDFAISGTTITVKKLDGATAAYTLTMDAAASSATSSTRAT